MENLSLPYFLAAYFMTSIFSEQTRGSPPEKSNLKSKSLRLFNSFNLSLKESSRFDSCLNLKTLLKS